MKRTVKFIRNVALGLGIAGALVFGATRATAYTHCRECTEPPPTACQHYADPDLFCENLCVNEQGCWGGECLQQDECRCFAK